MSLNFRSGDGLHIERLNAKQMGGSRRGIFINGAAMDDNGKTQSEHQPASFIQVRNNLNISPGDVGREAFTEASSKVRDKVEFSTSNGVKKMKEKGKLCHYIRIMQITNNILAGYNF